MNDTLQIVCPHDDAINRVPHLRLTDNPKCGKCHGALFTAEPIELTAARFELYLSRNEIPMLVDFWAPWCGPCRVMAPAYKEAASTLEPHMRLAKLDTESHPVPAQRFGIRSIPTLILFAGGHEVARQSGAMPASQIVQWARSAAAAAR